MLAPSISTLLTIYHAGAEGLAAQRSSLLPITACIEQRLGILRGPAVLIQKLATLVSGLARLVDVDTAH